MQIDGEKDPNKCLLSICSVYKICGGRDHCFMCDIIKSRNPGFTSCVWETSHFVKTIQIRGYSYQEEIP